MTMREAAEQLHIPYSAVVYYAMKNKIRKHPTTPKRFLVDVNEVWDAFEHASDITYITPELRAAGYITRIEAAKILYVTDRQITYYIQRGYIHRYFLLSTKRNYLLKLEEVYGVPAILRYNAENHAAHLKEILLKNPQPKNKHGKYISRKTETVSK
jgi:hypothetical protein